MTARQQIARLLPLVLLVVLVIAGLRGSVPAPGWNGPLRAYGIAIGIALEPPRSSPPPPWSFPADVRRPPR
jgi:hypothetical protein